MNIKTAKQLAAAAENVARNYKTLYVMGCFGAPMTAKNKKRYCNNHKYNKDPERTAMINAASEDTFGFDCVCLFKGLLWDWVGDKTKVYGGAKYRSNGVPDVSADGLIKRCKDVSTDFKKIVVGEIVHTPGHVGIYIGEGLAVECTPSWENKVQITAVANIGFKSGYKARWWKKHGKLPYVEYTDEEKAAEKPDVIYQVYAAGKWWGEITNYNTKNSNGYAGVMGEEISGIRVRLSNGETVTVQSHISGEPKSEWLEPVTKWDNTSDGYSGWKGRDTDCIAMKAEGCTLKYRVHVKGGGWLSWIKKCDIKDYDFGMAGIYGSPIDAVQIQVV